MVEFICGGFPSANHQFTKLLLYYILIQYEAIVKVKKSITEFLKISSHLCVAITLYCKGGTILWMENW